MRFRFRPIEAGDFEQIAFWRYDPPYDFYDWDLEDALEPLLDPVEKNLVLLDDADTVAGFAFFGPGGQVPGGVEAGAYLEPLLDIGLGLRPDLTGRGIGLEFVLAVIEKGREFHQPAGFRLTVATFNERAIRVYKRAGFAPERIVWSRSTGELTEFLVMTREHNAESESLPG
jgi:ribosomal-protein-alanine N-acetyltransferase